MYVQKTYFSIFFNIGLYIPPDTICSFSHPLWAAGGGFHNTFPTDNEGLLSTFLKDTDKTQFSSLKSNLSRVLII
jgi:hypothetical protein